MKVECCLLYLCTPISKWKEKPPRHRWYACTGLRLTSSCKWSRLRVKMVRFAWRMLSGKEANCPTVSGASHCLVQCSVRTAPISMLLR